MALFYYADKIALKQLIDNAKVLFANKTEVGTSISNINKSLDKKGEAKTINTLLPGEDGNVQVATERRSLQELFLMMLTFLRLQFLMRRQLLVI